jgi:DNA (cytosine-5)-methyltransferase 1
VSAPFAPADTLDLFAGAGGWDCPGEQMGLRILGVELDRTACATRAAAGLPTVRADAAGLDLSRMAGRITGLIASPPCTMFSQAGTQAARLLLAILADLIRDGLRGERTRAKRAAQMRAALAASRWPRPRTRPSRKARKVKVPVHLTRAQRSAVIAAAVQSAALVAAPARYIAQLRPEWIAMEQVAEALPLWEVYAAELRAMGYSAWCGTLNAADYGVPQTRRRAILIASRVRKVAMPPPTHRDPEARLDLMNADLPPWMSMHEAIGRGATAVPVPTITAGGTSTGGAEPWPTRARAFLASQLAAGLWEFRVDKQAKAVRRTLDRPAQTIKSGHSASSEMAWISPTREASLLEPWEAAVLQSFPRAWPWAGGRGQQFRQIGNAIPCELARHVLAMASGRPALPAAAAA